MNNQKQNGADQSAASNPASQQDAIHNSNTLNEAQYRITRGDHIRQTVWNNVQSYTSAELRLLMTDHQEGEKDGLCFTPAVFRGTKRTKMDAEQIDLLVFDCDTGETLEEIKTALGSVGLNGIIYSTHSHMKDTENPCPKFRVILPLETPWQASNFDNQKRANEAWAVAIFDVADDLGLRHDQSCKDTSRAYFFPRHSKGAEYVTEVIEGKACSIDWDRYKQPKQSPSNSYKHNLSVYVQTALNDELSIIRSALEGDRNNQLNKSAYTLARLIPEGLEERIIVNELAVAAHDIGLDREEANTTIISAIKAGISQPRGKINSTSFSVKKIEDFDGHFEPIVPFDQYNTPIITSDILHSSIGDYTKNMSDILCVPEALPVMAALGVVSCAISKKFVVSPKEDWSEPVNIYAAIALPPGSVKSLVNKRLVTPIEDWEEQEEKRIRPIREQQIAELKSLELKLKRAENIIKAQKSKPEDLRDAEQQLVSLMSDINIKKSQIIPLPKLYANNVTPEALEQYLHEQQGRFAIISDEGGIIETLSGLYSSGKANVDIVLKGIDGGSVRIKRKDREYTLNPYLSLVLVVQPQILNNMGAKGTFKGNGFLERFLYVLPIENIGYRTITDDILDEHYETQYSNLIYNLLSIEQPKKPYTIKLSSPAKSLWMAFRADIEKEMRADGMLYICRGWGAKLAGYTLRIAGLMHVARHQGANNLTIEEDTMKNAITLARLLCEHTICAYGLMAIDQETQDAKELLEWIKAQEDNMLTKTKIVNGVRNRGMGKKDRLSKAISLLIERNILSDLHKDYSSKKPTDCYFINPNL
ncbi:MAG: YfjI family protein [Alphaproteobacteria bacterium]